MVEGLNLETKKAICKEVKQLLRLCVLRGTNWDIIMQLAKSKNLAPIIVSLHEDIKRHQDD